MGAAESARIVGRKAVSDWKLKSVDGIVRFWRPFPTIAVVSSSAVEKVAAQLRASVPVGKWETTRGSADDWIIKGLDRSREFAQIFEANGISDLTKLILVQCTFTRVVDEVWIEDNYNGTRYKAKDAYTEELQGYALSSDGNKPFGFMYGDGRREDRMRSNPVLHVMRSTAGDGGTRLVMRVSEDGFYFVPNWYSTSDASKVRDIFKAIASVAIFTVLPLAGINAASALGGAIMGPLAGTYPALTSAIGRVAISTALSGGNLKGALKMTALSLIGSQAGTLIGNAVADSTKLELLGKVAEAGTRAALAGGDVKQAVGMTLLQNGIASMGQLLGEGDDVIPSWGGSDDLPAVQYMPPPMPDIPVPSFTVEASPGIDWKNLQNIVTNVTNTAVSVARGIEAIKSVSNPQVVRTAQITLPSGVRTTALDSGYVEQTNSAGQTFRQAPPVGTVQGTVSGNLMVNNGNGTYTLIASDGTRRTLQYSAGVSNVAGNTPPAQTLSSFLATTISTPIGNIPVLPIVGIGLAMFLMGAMGNRK